MTTHNEPDNQRSDGLNAARGVMYASLLGAVIWAAGLLALGAALGILR